MSALLTGHAASLAALLLALAMVALIALVARQWFDAAHGRRTRPHDRVAMDERIKARIEATIWPD
jgi:hypothetical protein